MITSSGITPAVFRLLFLLVSFSISAYSYTLGPLSRKEVFGIVTAETGALVATNFGIQPAMAFDGSGASAYAGRNAGDKVALRNRYRERIIADVKDFKALGDAIDKGITQGNEWVNFFIQFKRREPDSVGRSYAALADLVGTTDGGGCGLLFASTFTKPGKPPENTPAYKQFNVLAKTFDPIEKAGKNGDTAKAKAAWNKSSEAFTKFLEAAEMPGSLSDPLYQ